MFGIKLEETRFYQEAKEEGRQEGLKQAREKILKQAREQGREEAKRELIPRFLAYGMSMEKVAQLLHLTIEQVKIISEQDSSTSS